MVDRAPLPQVDEEEGPYVEHLNAANQAESNGDLKEALHRAGSSPPARPRAKCAPLSLRARAEQLRALAKPAAPAEPGARAAAAAAGKNKSSSRSTRKALLRLTRVRLVPAPGDPCRLKREAKAVKPATERDPRLPGLGRSLAQGLPLTVDG